MTRPRLCTDCGVKPVAYPGRAHCYDCVPRVWKRPAACKRWGSTTDYFTAGLCRRCHRCGHWVEGCQDCFAWGVTRQLTWLCEGCRGWRRRHGPPQQCLSCQRLVVVNGQGFCRLCMRQATLVRPAHRAMDVMEANRQGQQLFLADSFATKRLAAAPARARPTLWPTHYPVRYRQLVLFDAARNYAAASASEFVAPLTDLSAALDQILVEHALRHGWGQGLQSSTRSALRVLLATQDTPGALIKASDAAAVTTGRSLDNLKSVLEILTAAGMLHEDQEPTLDAYFARLAAGLAKPMAAEFGHWFRIQRQGSTSPPRSRPRNIETVRAHIADAAPALHAWTDAGHQSLREISRQHVVDVLPAQTWRRRQTLGALRALFRFLKSHRLVFTNPTAGLRSAPRPTSHPLPLELTPLREAINSPHPARAALATLIAFHALRAHELCALTMTDLRDGRIYLHNRTVLLAEPVRAKLADWLEERTRRWPNTINPHLFINGHTGVRTCPVNRVWITATLGVSAQAIREDRILHEARTTAGDLRRLCDLFGLTIGGAERYAHTIDQPALADPQDVGSRTPVRT